MPAVMSKPLRYMPSPNTTYEVTTRTIQGRLLLVPSEQLNDIILGILGRALSLYPILLHLVVFASNHFHLIVTAPDLDALAAFMRYVNSNLAREAGRLHQWKEKFWGRRYRSIAITDDEALLDRVRYLLSHGCKEFLVLRPEDWPGVQCVRALTHGHSLHGTWYDRTAEYEARRRGQEFSPKDFATRYEVPLAPLPCWKDLSEAERQSKFRRLVEDIEQKTLERLGAEHRGFMGADMVCRMDPHHRPRNVKRSPAPCCHASSTTKWKEFRDGYRWFASLYRAAANRLKRGESMVRFPDNCFPPALAFSGCGADSANRAPS